MNTYTYNHVKTFLTFELLKLNKGSKNKTCHDYASWSAVCFHFISLFCHEHLINLVIKRASLFSFELSLLIHTWRNDTCHELRLISKS